MTDMVRMLVDLTRARQRQDPSEWIWLGFNTHLLRPLLSSAVFSPPTTLLLADVRGSFGKQKTWPEGWGPQIGEVDHTHLHRDFFRSLYDARLDPALSMRNLWGELRARLVKKPVVRYAYILREGAYMLWHYRYIPRKNVVWSQEARESLAKNDVESTFTIDIFAADKTPLETGDSLTAIQQAHDEGFLYDTVRPILLSARGEPSPIVRRETGETPRYIKRATPIRLWVRQT